MDDSFIRPRLYPLEQLSESLSDANSPAALCFKRLGLAPISRLFFNTFGSLVTKNLAAQLADFFADAAELDPPKSFYPQSIYLFLK